MKIRKNRDTANRRRNTLRRERPSLALWREARKRARQRNLPFDIEVSDVPIPALCPVLGMQLVWGRGRRQMDDSPTLDRIRPELGYTKNNVWVISWRANRLKSDATLEELRAVVSYVERAAALGVAVTAFKLLKQSQEAA